MSRPPQRSRIADIVDVLRGFASSREAAFALLLTCAFAGQAHADALGISSQAGRWTMALALADAQSPLAQRPFDALLAEDTKPAPDDGTPAVHGSDVVPDTGIQMLEFAHYRKKSIPLAFVLSAAVPGLGEGYAEAAWWRIVLPMAVGVGLVTGHFALLAHGHQQERDFQAFLDAHWDPTRFMNWQNALPETLNLGQDPNTPNQGSSHEILPWSVDPPYTLDTITGVRTTVGVPNRTQQYYEMSGKYDWFVIGWDDYSSTATTPNRWSTLGNSLANRDHYLTMREQANSSLKTANTLLGVYIGWAVASAFDAAWSAWQFNDTHKEGFTQLQLKPGVRVAFSDDQKTLLTQFTLSGRF